MLAEVSELGRLLEQGIPETQNFLGRFKELDKCKQTAVSDTLSGAAFKLSGCSVIRILLQTIPTVMPDYTNNNNFVVGRSYS